ncbi:MAG TPA: hypothetical protein VIT44_08055 [Cyclobacteriaceae bacterium]
MAESLVNPKKYYQSEHIILLSAVFLSVNAVINVAASLKGQPYPYTSFLLDPNDRFGDFFKVIDALHLIKTWVGIVGEVNIYSRPFSSVYYLIFTKLIIYVGNEYFVYAVLCLTVFTIISLLSRACKNSYLTTILVLLSYPMIFCIDRGNFAFVVFMLLFATLVTENLILATLFIALASSLKLAPIIFLIPLIFKEEVTLSRITKIVILEAIWLLLINLISILLLRQEFGTRGSDMSQFNTEINYYYDVMIAGLNGLGYGSSMYMPMVWIAHKLDFKYEFLKYIKPITLPIIVFGLAGLWFLIKGGLKKKIIELMAYDKLIFIASICFILFMPVAADYYLLILFLPLLLFPQCNYSLGYLFVYGMLMGAKNIFYLGQVHGAEGLYLSLQVFINPVLLLLLLLAELDLIGFMKRESPRYSENSNVTKKISFHWITILLISGVCIYVSQLYFSRVRLYHNLEKGLPPAFNPAIFLAMHRDLTEYWRTKEWELTKKKLFKHAEDYCKTHGGKIGWSHYLSSRVAHNEEIGLPSDFDPSLYLILNPQIQTFWKLRGLYERGQELFDRAELHYLYFGKKDGLRYK